MRVDEEQLYLHIGIQLKKKRESLRLSQKEVGERVGLGRASISQIEAGEQKPPLHVLYNLCIVLGLEPVEVLPSIANATTDPQRVNVAIDGRPMRVTRRTAKVLLKIAKLDEKK